MTNQAQTAAPRTANIIREGLKHNLRHILLVIGLMILSAGINVASPLLFNHMVHVQIRAFKEIQASEVVFGTTRECGRIGRVFVAERLVYFVYHLILFDEAPAALDALTEARLRQAIDGAREGRTFITVAHRLATVMHADKIIVIDHGRIAEAGTPEELLASGGLSRQMYEAQALSSP